MKVKAGSQDRKLEAGTEVEAVEECYSLAFFLILAQFSVFSKSLTSQLPKEIFVLAASILSLQILLFT